MKVPCPWTVGRGWDDPLGSRMLQSCHCATAPITPKALAGRAADRARVPAGLRCADLAGGVHSVARQVLARCALGGWSPALPGSCPRGVGNRVRGRRRRVAVDVARWDQRTRCKGRTRGDRRRCLAPAAGRDRWDRLAVEPRAPGQPDLATAVRSGCCTSPMTLSASSALEWHCSSQASRCLYSCADLARDRRRPTVAARTWGQRSRGSSVPRRRWPQESLRAVVRDRHRARASRRGRPGSGLAGWTEILPGLYELPVGPPDLRRQWPTLRDVSADHRDFAAGTRERDAETMRNGEILSESRQMTAAAISRTAPAGRQRARNRLCRPIGRCRRPAGARERPAHSRRRRGARRAHGGNCARGRSA